jgi:hypothetical protein
MNPNFHHYSRSPHCQTQPDPLDSEDPPSTSRKVDRCPILLKNRKKLLSVQVAELTAFQCSKVHDIDDDTSNNITLQRFQPRKA